ncbi:polyprenyl glycosylphosphotransferase [Hyphomicrobium methylovorum]|nr:exopolysaccharide biosynthesis polyprenyl glycosylphosphotransferase [Hyphomicrobium methylovorum]MBA2127412.1 polyprenyl glycosylphosphotransferase [Hyphomicrobium methylovorum]
MHCRFTTNDPVRWNVTGKLLVNSGANSIAADTKLRWPRFALTYPRIGAAAFFIEILCIIAAAVATGSAYHVLVYGSLGSIGSFAAIGALIAMGFGLASLIREEYGVESLLDGRRTAGRLFINWNIVFVALAVIGFLTKGTQIYSRGWLTLFYVFGFITVLLFNVGLRALISLLIARSWVRCRKLMIVATDTDLSDLEREIVSSAAGFAVAARMTLGDSDADRADLDAALSSAVAKARALGIEDVIISNSLSGEHTLEKTVAAFSALPVAIHLSAGGFLARFKHVRVARFGHAAALSITRAPLGSFEAAAKRAFDFIVASLALVLLAPLFALIGLVIKLDSKGPVFFKQRRRGYNTAEFRIWKFRTMTTLDDGDTIRQATKGDARITAIGNFLRRTSLDELPQLINVIKGEMSLVGPRPHAVAHDREFERRIADYPRRLNVKPGITGWAQVNGFRGATITDDAMRQRVEHDLFYIDNCSMGFDLYIILLTLISPKASRNAL